MDPLRGNIKKLMNSVNSIILEKDDLIELLDGRVDGIIKNHLAQDAVFTRVIAEDDTFDVKPVDPRTDNGIIDTQQYTLEMAQQIITSFNNEYDEQATADIEHLRKKKSKKSKRQVIDYDETLAIVNQLKKQHNL